MNNNCVFTICATNYVGLATVLENSIKKFSPKIDFYIVVADEPNADCLHKLPPNVIVAKHKLPYNDEKWYDMAFKYNITEFCTSIKPSSILYFMEMGYEKVIYLDPDILFFSSIEPIFEKLKNYSCIITPHITFTDNTNSDKRLLSSGAYNFGFIGFSNNEQSINVLKWWSLRLEDFAFDSMSEGLFTDQKWGDMIPSYLGNDVYISQNLGYNLAPWNFSQREIYKENNLLYVRDRCKFYKEKDLLMFVHYSGFNYRELVESGKVSHKNINNISSYPDLEIIFEIYSDLLLNSEFRQFNNECYTYNYFKDSQYIITQEMRRLYRGISESHKVNYTTFNHFRTDGDLFKLFNKIGLITKYKDHITYKFNTQSSYVSKSAIKLASLLDFIYKIAKPRNYFKLIRIFRRLSILENHYFLLLKDKNIYDMRNQ